MKKEQEHRTARNLIERNFKADRPDQKYTTDVTEMHFKNKKVYISAIKDLFSKEIISFDIGLSNSIEFTNKTLNRALRSFQKIS